MQKKVDKQIKQLRLFDQPSLNIVARLKAAMRQALSESKFSREEVAEKMTAIAKIEGIRLPGNSKSITKTILDKWVAEGANHTIPIQMLIVFCSVTDSCLPLNVLAAALGFKVITPEQRKSLMWAEAEIQRRHFATEARRLAKEVTP